VTVSDEMLIVGTGKAKNDDIQIEDNIYEEQEVKAPSFRYLSRNCFPENLPRRLGDDSLHRRRHVRRASELASNMLKNLERDGIFSMITIEVLPTSNLRSV